MIVIVLFYLFIVSCLLLFMIIIVLLLLISVRTTDDNHLKQQSVRGSNGVISFNCTCSLYIKIISYILTCVCSCLQDATCLQEGNKTDLIKV